MIKIKLSKLLGNKKMTQKELSEMTGIRAPTISEMYNEMCERVSLDHLDKICDVLGCDLPELLERVPHASIESEPSTKEKLHKKIAEITELINQLK